MTLGIAVPNLNQGRFLDAALDSLHAAGPMVRVAVLDAGSSDSSLDVIRAHAAELAWWRTGPDAGQAAAVNEGILRLCSMYPEINAVGWLNADDFFLPGGVAVMSDTLAAHPEWAAVTARGALAADDGTLNGEVPTAPFSRSAFARACTVCQPASLVRRTAWESVGGLNAGLDMCFDYDLWWRVARIGPIGHVDRLTAASRDHAETKTRSRRRAYFREATAIVRRETGRVGWHWYISEALERQVGYAVGQRPPVAGRLRAGAQAVVGYFSDDGEWFAR